MKEFYDSCDWLGRTGPFNDFLEYKLFYLLFAAAAIFAVIFLVKKKNPKLTKIALITIWVINLVFDMFKLYGLSLDGNFNVGGDMLLYICSLFLYAMPFALWGKEKLKNIACTFICTIGLFGAIMNFAFPGVIDSNSLFSFWGIHTTVYHLNLLLVPAIMIATGYFKVNWRNFGWAFLFFFIMTIPALFFNFMADTDWMYLKYGYGLPFPFVSSITQVSTTLWTLIAYVGYALIQALLLVLIWGIGKLVEKIKAKIVSKKAAKNQVEETPKQEVTPETTVEVEPEKPAKALKPQKSKR